jgi:hypothetical protein
MRARMQRGVKGLVARAPGLVPRTRGRVIRAAHAEML